MSSLRRARAPLCLAAIVATTTGVGVVLGGQPTAADPSPGDLGSGALPGPVTLPVAEQVPEATARAIVDALETMAEGRSGARTPVPHPARRPRPSVAPRPASRPRSPQPRVVQAPRPVATVRVVPATPRLTPRPAAPVTHAVAASVSVPSVAAARAYALAAVGAAQFSCLDTLWMRESSWNPYASNASTGAYGIPQALPGSKMATAGADWRVNPVTQVRWGLSYIASAYGTPCAALAHENAVHWY